MTEILSKYNWTSVGVFVGIIVIAHLFTSSLYDWKNNTISELAAQNYNYRWIMKIGFILFGGILAIGILNKLINGNGKLLTELPILIYGVAILVSGLYSTKPIIEGIEYSELESQIHTYSAQIAGISFSIGFSALFGLLESNVGIIQRAMYLGSFVWLVFFYNE